MKIYQDNKEKIEDSLFIITVLISFTSLDKGTQPFVVCDG